MANSSKKAIEEFLDESFEDESDISNVYDSDADPEYRPGENNTNINFAGPSQSLELTSADDPSADESFSESSSDSSDDEPIDNRQMIFDNIVLTLMKPFLNKGHSLYMDNFYNSVTLSNILLEKKTHTTGTLRSNRRGNPKEVTTKKLKRGDHIWRRNKNVYVSKWKDKRDVLCLTTKNHPKIIPSKNKYGILKNKPAEIVDYNNCMSGIDRSDQMVSYYSSPRKSARWYKKVLYHMLDITTWNSYFIYKKHFNTNISFKQFRDLLIKNLIGIPMQTTATDLFQIKKTKIQAPENNHYAEKIPVPKNYKRQTYFKNCIQCYKTKIRKQTSFQCKVCGKPLCPGKCFEEWHNHNQ